MIADDFSVALERVGEAPPGSDLDTLKDLDSISGRSDTTSTVHPRIQTNSSQSAP